MKHCSFDLVNGFEVCISFQGKETRLPPVALREDAERLAREVAKVYTFALIEIAHNGLRESVPRTKPRRDKRPL